MAEWHRNMVVPPKDPAAIKDYEFDWTDWLTAGEVISLADVTVGAGLTKDVASIVNSSTGVQVFVSGGTDGEKYKITCEVTTDSTPTRTELRSIYVEVATQ